MAYGFNIYSLWRVYLHSHNLSIPWNTFMICQCFVHYQLGMNLAFAQGFSKGKRKIKGNDRRHKLHEFFFSPLLILDTKTATVLAPAEKTRQTKKVSNGDRSDPKPEGMPHQIHQHVEPRSGMVISKRWDENVNNTVSKSVPHCSSIVAEGKNLMRKLESDHMQITPRNWRTLRRVPNELFIAKLCGVISAPLTVNDRAVTSCAALFSWCNL